MKKYLVIHLLFAFVLLHGLILRAQVTTLKNQPVSPKGGPTSLAIEYYKINFTKAQREKLENLELELIFKVDVLGNASLEKVNPSFDNDILDSLQRTTSKLPKFNPQVTNDVADPAIYFLMLRFPKYQMSESYFLLPPSIFYIEAKMENFEFIEVSKKRVDIIFGGAGNQFLGNIGKHLAFGGGMTIDMNFTAENQYFFGMNINFYGNRLIKKFPISTTREQFSAPPTMLLGIGIGKWITKSNIQLQLNYAIQNITENKGYNAGVTDPDWVQFKGFSSGIIINYPVKLGKDRTAYHYGSPSISNQSIDFHLGLRSILLSNKEAKGGMIEVGIGIRITSKHVKEYKLKEEFVKSVNQKRNTK